MQTPSNIPAATPSPAKPQNFVLLSDEVQLLPIAADRLAQLQQQHIPTPENPHCVSELRALQKQILAMRATFSLMAQAIHLVDDDIEKTGTVSAQTIEFLRSVKQVMA